MLLLVPFLIGSCSEEIGETPPAKDTAPPSITGHHLESGADGVSRSGPFWIAFSEAMDDASVVNALTFNPYAGGFNTTWLGDTLVITPYTLLAASTGYTITVGADSEDLGGNKLGSDYPISFTTSAEDDITPPLVTGAYPEGGASNVGLLEEITITFSEPMNIESVANALAVDPPISLAVPKWESTTMRIIHEPFPDDSAVTVTVGTGAADLAGNNLEENHVWSFRTLKDDTHPYLASASPPDGAAGVSTGIGQMVFQFSEPIYADFDMPAANLDARMTQAIDEPGIEWSEDLTTLTVPIKPDEDLLGGCPYWVKFGGLTDLAGNAIDPDPTPYGFTTIVTCSNYPVHPGALWCYGWPLGPGSPIPHTAPAARTLQTCKQTNYVGNYNPGTGTYDLVMEDYLGEILEKWHMSKTPSEIFHRGVATYEGGEYTGSMTWDDPLLYLKLPPEDHLGEVWQFSTTGTDGTDDLAIEGRVEIRNNRVDLVGEQLGGTFEECIIHHLYVDITWGSNGQSQAVHYHWKTWLAPCVGPVKIVHQQSGEAEADSLSIQDWEL